MSYEVGIIIMILNVLSGFYHHH